MKIFISWSGEKSLAAAKALKEWLPLVLQGAEPWLSSEDIRKGSRWQLEIASALNEAAAAVLCLTRDNLKSDWLLFEAGAVSKALAPSPTLVCTYLIDVTSADVPLPLGMFQATAATREDTLHLLQNLNDAMAPPVPDERLNRLFSTFWPDLEKVIRAAQLSQGAKPQAQRNQYEMIAEILGTVRALARRQSEQAGLAEEGVLAMLNSQEASSTPENAAAAEAQREQLRRILERSVDRVRTRRAAVREAANRPKTDNDAE